MRPWPISEVRSYKWVCVGHARTRDGRTCSVIMPTTARPSQVHVRTFLGAAKRRSSASARSPASSRDAWPHR
ncbi:hypothetical protein ACFPRL_20320 [Pseudoclavibacter helvolus]